MAELGAVFGALREGRSASPRVSIPAEDRPQRTRQQVRLPCTGDHDQPAARSRGWGLVAAIHASLAR